MWFCNTHVAIYRLYATKSYCVYWVLFSLCEDMNGWSTSLLVVSSWWHWSTEACVLVVKFGFEDKHKSFKCALLLIYGLKPYKNISTNNEPATTYLAQNNGYNLFNQNTAKLDGTRSFITIIKNISTTVNPMTKSFAPSCSVRDCNSISCFVVELLIHRNHPKSGL